MAARSLYYQHSGKYSLPGLALGAAVGLGAGAVLGAVYACILAYIPIVGYVSFVFAGGFGVLLGIAAGKGLRFGRVRSSGAWMLVAGVAAAFAWYVSWAVWLWAIINRGEGEITLGEILFHPGDLWILVRAVNEVGAWSLHSFTPKGAVLWVLWTVEVILIAGGALFVTWGAATGVPFCERCERWCDEQPGVLVVAAGDHLGELRRRLEAKDFAWLATLGSPEGQSRFFRFDLHSCGRCKDTHTLNAHYVELSVDKEGKVSEKATTVADKLLVTAAEAETIRRTTAGEAIVPVVAVSP